MDKYNLGLIDQILAYCDISLPHLWFQIDEEIDPDTFKEAVNRALVYHPTFKSKFIKQKGVYYLQIGEEEYLWSYNIEGNNAYFNGPHAQSDAGGFFQFIHTIWRMYFELKGERFEGDFALNDLSRIEETICDPYEKYAFRNQGKQSEKEKKKKPFRIPKKLFISGKDGECLKQFVFDEEEIKEISKAAGSTVCTVISAILAKAMARSTGAEKGTVNVGVPVNLRVTTNSNTDRCFSITPDLQYDVEEGERNSLAEVSKALKEQFARHLKPEALLGKITEMHKLGIIATKFPVLLKLAHRVYQKMRLTTRAQIVYSHIKKHGFDDQVLKHIKMIQLIPLTGIEQMHHIAFAVSFKGKIYMNIHSTLKDNVWANKIEEVLKEFGITYEVNGIC